MEESNRIPPYNILAVMGTVFAVPPLVLWLSVVWYQVTGFGIFQSIVTNLYLSGSPFSEFLVGFAYPATALFFGIVARAQTKDGRERGFRLSKTSILLGSGFLTLTVVFYVV